MPEALIEFGSDAYWVLKEVIDHAPALSAFVAVGTLIKVSWEWTLKNRLERSEKYSALSEQYHSDPTLSKVRAALSNGSTSDGNISDDDLGYFLGFMERIAMMEASGVIKIKVVHYMFGYHILQAADDPDIAKRMGLGKSHLWTGFDALVKRVRKMDTDHLRLYNAAREKHRFLSAPSL